MKSYCSFRFVQKYLLEEFISKTAEILLLWCALTTSVCVLIASCWAWQLADMDLNSDGKKHDIADLICACVCVSAFYVCVCIYIIVYKYIWYAYIYLFMCLRKKFHFTASTEFENSFDLKPLSSKRQLIWPLKW